MASSHGGRASPSRRDPLPGSALRRSGDVLSELAVPSGVRAVAPGAEVIPCPTVEPVVPTLANDGVEAAVPQQDVVAGSASSNGVGMCVVLDVVTEHGLFVGAAD